MKPQLQMIVKCLDYIVLKENIHKEEAFSRLLDYCAYQIGISDAMIKLKLSSYEFVKDNLDFDLLKKDCWDWFGELWEMTFRPPMKLSTRKSINKHVDKCINMLKGTNEGMPQSIIDKSSGTGRFLLIAKERSESNLMCYGIENDIVAYKVCIFNMKLHNVPSKILWCPDIKKFDVSPKSSNWFFSNFWNPVSKDKLAKA